MATYFLIHAERASRVLDLRGPGILGRESVVTDDRHPPSSHELVQHRTTLFALVPDRPRPAVHVEDHRRVLRRRRHPPDVQAMSCQRAVVDIAHELHVARVKRQLQRRAPPRAEAVLVGTRELEWFARTPLQCTTHHVTRAELNANEREVLCDDDRREHPDQHPEPVRARKAPPLEHTEQCRLDEDRLDREFAGGPSDGKSQDREDPPPTWPKGRERRKYHPGGHDRHEIGHQPLSSPRRTGSKLPRLRRMATLPTSLERLRGTVGIWTSTHESLAPARSGEISQELEELGYAAMWFPEAWGRESFTSAGLLLASTSSITLATGIANIWARDAVTTANAARTLNAAFNDRFVLGLGVSHEPLVTRLRGHDYDKPLQIMREYLTALRAAPMFAEEGSHEFATVIAALGPRMLELGATLV